MFSGVFLGCFQGVFPYALSGYALWPFPILSLFEKTPFRETSFSDPSEGSSDNIGVAMPADSHCDKEV